MEYIVEYSSHLTSPSNGIQITAYVTEKGSGYCTAHFSETVEKPSWLSKVIFKETLATRVNEARSELGKTVKAFVEAKSKERILLGEVNQILSSGIISETIISK